MGRDYFCCPSNTTKCNFNPRAPCGARPSSICISSVTTNFNPRAPCGARRLNRTEQAHLTNISIHAPRVGRDSVLCTRFALWFYFNPRAPCGARLPCGCCVTISVKFQSTRPVWGATNFDSSMEARTAISIHAPRVGRDPMDLLIWYLLTISIHAPRVGRDVTITIQRTLRDHFNPRAPCGARPDNVCLSNCPRGISIHAPRVGRDDSVRAMSYDKPRFQSTRPVWGAT